MTSPTAQLRRRRRLLAVATAGLALCIGVSVTSLAAWQQNIQVAPGTGSAGIGASLLSIEISVNGGPWTTATLNSYGNLSFGTNSALLTPSDTVYAGVRLRAGIGSRGAKVKLSGGAVSDLLMGTLTYAARTGIANAECNNANFPDLTSFDAAGTTLVGLGSALSSGSGSTTFTIPAATSAAAGTPVGICLAVTLPGGIGTAVSGLTTSPVWQFDATSV